MPVTSATGWLRWEVGMMEKNLQCLRGAHDVLDPSKVFEAVAEMCPASKNSKSKRMNKILHFGCVSNYRYY